MIIEVLSPSKAAAPRRALVFSICTLLGVSLLAAAMASRRAGDPLGPRIQPDSGEVSFRAPKRFVPGDAVYTHLMTIHPFYGRSETGADAVLAVWEIAAYAGHSPEDIWGLILEKYDAGPARPGPGPEILSTPKRLGDLDGLEVVGPRAETLIRVAVDPGGVGYAVSLAVKDEPIDEPLYDLFDLTCRSMTQEKTSSGQD